MLLSFHKSIILQGKYKIHLFKNIYTSTRGLYRESDSRIDVWGKGDSSGHYDHYYYNGPDDYGKAPDNRHE